MVYPVWSYPNHVSQIPNGNISSCLTCHLNQHGGGLNAFGRQISDSFLDENLDILWGPDAAALDADGDGASNGTELQDPEGYWSPDQPSPGNSAYVTLPGDSSSHPFVSITMLFSEMDPHIGQLFEFRVTVRQSDTEVMRTSLAPVISGSFVIEIDELLLGQSYRIDFYADHNGNGIYDPPPTDHTWRLDAYYLTGDETLSFVHNTSFYDIDWPSQTRIDLYPGDTTPREYSLDQNYPNPFNPATDIRYQIPDNRSPIHTSLQIYNVLGQLVRTLVNEVQVSGQYSAMWGGRNDLGRSLSSGVYFCRLDAGGYSRTIPMLYLK